MDLSYFSSVILLTPILNSTHISYTATRESLTGITVAGMKNLIGSVLSSADGDNENFPRALLCDVCLWINKYCLASQITIMYI